MAKFEAVDVAGAVVAVTRSVPVVALCCLLLLAGCGGVTDPGDGTAAGGSTPTGDGVATAGDGRTGDRSAGSGETTNRSTTPADEGARTATARPATTRRATAASPTSTGSTVDQRVEIPVVNGTVPFDHERAFLELREMAGRESPPPRQVYVTSGRTLPENVRDPFVRRLLDVRPPVEVEGGADYLTFQYLRARGDHLTDRVRNPSESFAAKTVLNRYADATYYYGREYVAAVSDSPADHWDVYEDPPNTTERLLHPEDGVDFDRQPMSVAVDAPGWRVTRNESMGELVVRQALWSELNRSWSRAASTGWGVDRLIRIEGDDVAGYVWSLRFDDVREADEFETAAREYLDARASREGDHWIGANRTYGLDRLGNEPVVLVLGHGPFVRQVVVAGSSDEVRIDRRDE